MYWHQIDVESILLLYLNLIFPPTKVYRIKHCPELCTESFLTPAGKCYDVVAKDLEISCKMTCHQTPCKLDWDLTRVVKLVDPGLHVFTDKAD